MKRFWKPQWVTLMKFKIWGTEVYVSFLFSAVITAMIAFDRTGYVLPLLFAVVMHESGHLIAMFFFGCAPKKIRLVPAAVEITAKPGKKDKHGIIISLCGPLVNILLFFALWFNYLAFRSETSLVFALINLLIGIFNLIPVTGLDGGTVLFNLLCKRREVSKAILIMRIINISLAAISLVTAVTLAFRGTFNLSLFIIGLYLIVMSLIKI